ncbi:hypothetical protein BHF71_09120 [Vulcanibacillus modesticaldus]|uniref:Uncharacterized protein n=1 Tax=Vulcanibacillus modesticaldus TaxID=337097 RepID=A0A1D2YUS1_9BACI|nr:hypothetical protein [Vulcanibacillus modesticaldus]OEF99462.1 hypothetical protein BHF71_09120 [Vulcanibacillus modesticaldus]
MKKIIAMLLVGLMLIGGTGAVFAQELAANDQQKLLDERYEMRELHFKAIKEFQEEFHKINQLKRERLGQRIEISEKHDTILDLYIVAKENGDREALFAAREIRKEIRAVNREIKALFEEVHSERKAFRVQVKNDDFKAAQIHLNNVISLLEKINDKLEIKKELLDSVIEVLSGDDVKL